VGCNNAMSMSMHAEGMPGLRGNYVYWIGGSGRDQGMVFDMEIGLSARCQVPRVGPLLPMHHRQRIICWYFLNDDVAMNFSMGISLITSYIFR
jgi:hypothetical protein